ncbi:hypothetical protein F5148DRAFT_1292480 [Russula earlei]|uniref:Uncharacterized protein n=1 Tax=Russula earlei TaxID=71964 RepID=A0ACC0TU58_9AGAM|nr:hypothetical protein F5148DRAFT_1292480 [Russula earlei]
MALWMLFACRMQPGSAQDSPPGYNLAAPVKWIMPEELDEISGIAFYTGIDPIVHVEDDNPYIYAEQDEEGRIYRLRKGMKPHSTKFGKPGDYEDIAINKEQVIMLRSDGVLFTFPFSETSKEKTATTKEWKGLLPQGEYESLAVGRDGNLVVICKNCPVDNQEKEVSAYIIQQDTAGNLSLARSFKIDISSVDLTSIHKQIKFHPSCVAQHPITHEWFLISSVNKVLIVLNEQWKVKASYALNPNLFKQPEGLAFDTKGTMYISNENADVGNANILEFIYQK